MKRSQLRRLALAFLGAVVGFAVYYADPASATVTQTGTCAQTATQIASNGGVALSANLDTTVPTNHQYVMQSLRVNLSTNSSAGARTFTVAVVDGSGNELWLDPAPTTQASSLSRTYVGQAGRESFTINGSVIGVRLPDFPLQEGWKFRIKQTGLSTSDVVSAGWITYCDSTDQDFPTMVDPNGAPFSVVNAPDTSFEVNFPNPLPVSGTVGLSSNHFLLDTSPVTVSCASGCSGGSTGTTTAPTTTTIDTTLVGAIETTADGTGQWMSSDALPAFTGWALAVLGGLGICLVSYKLLRRAA